MITGQWGKPSEVLLDIVVDSEGTVRGIVNPGRENAPIQRGIFNPVDSTVHLEGEVTLPDGQQAPFRISGHLDNRTLRLTYAIGDDEGAVGLVRVEEYRPPRLTLYARLGARLDDVKRAIDARTRPKPEVNAARLRARGESLDSVRVRDATAADIPALAELHVTLWNATYHTSRGPSVATRTRQWATRFAKDPLRDFVVVMTNCDSRLIGFALGTPNVGEFGGQLAKIYLQWEYHGLGLGRRLMAEAARRFLDRGITSMVLFAERSNPSIGFYDRMGGERLIDERGLFTGAYAWRDVRLLLSPPPSSALGHPPAGVPPDDSRRGAFELR